VFYFNFLDAARDIPKNPVVCVTGCPNSTIGNTSNWEDYSHLFEHENINLCRYDIGEEHFSSDVNFDKELCPTDVTPQ
jgi:hypothetical protein